LRQKIIFISALITLTVSCNNIQNQIATAKSLNDSVLVLTRNYQDTSQYENALILIQKAIKLDTNYLETYSKKLFFEENLGQFDDAIVTLSQLIRLRRDSAELYLKQGIYQEIQGDTINAKNSFNRSLPRYTILLDTLNKSHPERRNLLNMLAINIIMLGQEKMLHELLKENYRTSFDSVLMSTNVLGKTKKELLEPLRQKYNR